MGKNQNHQTGQPFTDVFMVAEKQDEKERNKTLKFLIKFFGMQEFKVPFNNRGNKMYLQENQYQGRRIFSALIKGDISAMELILYSNDNGARLLMYMDQH